MVFNTIKITDAVSTNTQLKKMALEGADVGTALVAQRQSGGRGRLGRSFSSGEGGLYASIILPYCQGDDAGLLTTYAAVAVAHAIERVAPVKVGIKWVNDLYVNGKKVCGILAEAVAREGGMCAILGIGVNLTNKLPPELSDIATTLFDACGTEVAPDKLFDVILDELSGFEKVDRGEKLDEYRHRCVILDKNIDVIPHNGEKYTAKAIDVLPDGALLVKRAEDGEMIRVFSGEVSARLSEGET